MAGGLVSVLSTGETLIKEGACNQHLYRAIQKYGWDNFIFDTLHENVPKEKLNELEKQEIARFDCNSCRGGWGYNKTDGGDGILGHMQSAKVRKKMSDGQKGKKNHNFGKTLSAEQRQKMSEARKGKYTGEKHPMYGRSPSPEVRQRISEKLKGRKLNVETRQKMSEARMGEKNPNYGKSPSTEQRRKLSEAGRRPEYTQAHWSFVLSGSIGVIEKRQQLYVEFSNVPKRTIRKWVSQWQFE